MCGALLAALASQVREGDRFVHYLVAAKRAGTLARVTRTRIGPESAREVLALGEGLESWVGEHVSDEGVAQELWERGNAHTRKALLGNRWMSLERITTWESEIGQSFESGRRRWAGDVVEDVVNPTREVDWVALVDELGESRGVSGEHYLALAREARESGADAALGRILARSLESEWAAPGVGDVMEITLGDIGALDANRSTMAELVLLTGLEQARWLTDEAVRELLRLYPWAKMLGSQRVPDGHLVVSRETERLLVDANWWWVLAWCAVSEETFEGLVTRWVSGEVVASALAGLVQNAGRMERVLTAWTRSGTQYLSYEFVRRAGSWLWCDSELVRRTLGVCSSEVVIRTVTNAFPIRPELGEEKWLWMDEEWLESLGEAEHRGITEYLALSGRCSSDTLAHMVLRRVRGAAYVAMGSSGPLSTQLATIVDEMFGDNTDLALGLLNPATNLVELCDVIGRL